MNSLSQNETLPKWRDRLGRGLMGLAALGALAAFFSGLASVSAAASDTVWVETWRLFGFLVFTGMFALVALRPRRSAGIWELAFFHKAGMAASALFLSGAKEAAPAGTIDGALAVLIVIAYVLTRGWMAWKS